MVTGVIFGVAALAWSGWAQERPPAGVVWRVVLVVLQVATLVLIWFGISAAVRYWDTPTAIDPGGAAFNWYIAVFWLEVIAIAGLSIFFSRTQRMQLIAPTVLIIVGLHFAPLAFVFEQSIMLVAALLISVAGAAALLLPRRGAAPSFWCGILAAPIFLILGVTTLLPAIGALTA